MSIRMSKISCCFHRSRNSRLTSATDGTLSIRRPSRWNTLSLSCYDSHQRPQTLLQRSLSSTTAIRDDTEVNVNVLSKKQKNAYVSKSIYRQMLRWCQNYQQYSYPPDLLQYFTKAPKHYTLVPNFFPAHDFILQKFIQLQHNPQRRSDDPGRHPTSPTASMERIYTFLKQIPVLQCNPHNSNILVVNIQSIFDVQSCIRALYRLNISSSDDNSIESNEQEREEYEKVCRKVAFEEVKHMNEISVELQKCQNQRHIRLHREFNALQTFYNDCTDRNYNPSDKILPIGQVVQHKEDRWRGVIVHWSYDSGTQEQTKRQNSHPNKKSLSTTVRDDFTSLTLKSYTTLIESDDDSDVTKLDDPEGAIQVGNIAYEVALDGTYRNFFDDDTDDDSNSSDVDTSDTSSSSLPMKRHLLQTNQTSIPTFVSVQQPLLLPPPRNNAVGSDAYSDPSPSTYVLEVVQDEHLCRLHNPIIRRIFTRYDSLTKNYIPNTYINYTYPNWYPSNISVDDDIRDKSTATTLDPNILKDLNKNDNCVVKTSDLHSTKIMSDMIQQIKHFALYLVSVIDDSTGYEEQPTSTSNRNENENHHSNQLKDTISDLRNDVQAMALLDPTSAHLLFNALPLSKQLSLQLRSMEYVAMTVLDAMYKRRRNKATTITTTRESMDALTDTHQQETGASTVENNHFIPKFHLGQIVRHKKYNFRGVIVSRDCEPIYNVSRWDGLRDIPNAKELPFYKVIPDQQDCIEIFGGQRPTRYVCEVNLEPCPPDQMYLDVDVDVGWTKLSDGSFRPPPFERFKYGYDDDGLNTSDTTNDYDSFEKCMMAVESVLNQWHCECARDQLLSTQLSNNDDMDSNGATAFSSAVRQHAISIHDMLALLKVVDNVEDAAAIRESIKLFGKAHPNIHLRTQLQYGLDLMVADNCEKARTILRSIVTNDDPSYIEAWNYLANSENFLSLRSDALTSTRKVLELNKNHFQAYTQLGILHFQEGEYGKAEIYFRKCLDLDPWSIVSSKLSECIDLMNGRKDDNDTSGVWS